MAVTPLRRRWWIALVAAFGIIITTIAVPEVRRHVVLKALIAAGREVGFAKAFRPRDVVVESRLPEWVVQRLPPSLATTWLVQAKATMIRPTKLGTFGSLERRFFQSYPELTSVEWYGPVSDEECRLLAAMSNLKSLWMSDLSQAPAGIAYFRNHPSLNAINLNKATAGQAEFEALASCSHLEWVVLAGKFDVQHVSKLTRLKLRSLSLINQAEDQSAPRGIPGNQFHGLAGSTTLLSLDVEPLASGTLADLPPLPDLETLTIAYDLSFAEMESTREATSPLLKPFPHLAILRIRSDALLKECVERLGRQELSGSVHLPYGDRFFVYTGRNHRSPRVHLQVHGEHPLSLSRPRL